MKRIAKHETAWIWIAQKQTLSERWIESPSPIFKASTMEIGQFKNVIWVSLKISVTWYSPVVQIIQGKTISWSLGLICRYRGWTQTQTRYRLCRCLLICLSFWSSKTKGHCSENHSFSEPIIMNDRLWTMKVVMENVRKFVRVIKTKFLCLDNFHFPAKPTSHFHSIYPEYICRCRVQYQKKH